MGFQKREEVEHVFDQIASDTATMSDFFSLSFFFWLCRSIGKDLAEGYIQLASFSRTVRYPDVLGNSQPALVNRQLVANGPAYVGKDPAC